jgi:glutaredoxin
MNENMITIYSTPTCPKCETLKAYCKTAGILFEKKLMVEDLLEDAALRTDLMVRGIFLGTAAPVIQVGSSYFGPERFFDGNNLNETKLKELVG